MIGGATSTASLNIFGMFAGGFAVRRCGVQFDDLGLAFRVWQGWRRSGDDFPGNDQLAGRLDPATVFVEATVSADRSDYAVCRDGAGRGFLDDVFEAESHVAGAAPEEIEGVGVAVDGAAVRELEFVADVARASPLDEGFLDGFAFWMLADAAAPNVAVEVDGAVDRVGLFGEPPGIEWPVPASAADAVDFGLFCLGLFEIG